MLRYRVIPTLLLKNGGLVKTTRFKKPVYIGDPINAVKIFNEKEVDELILLDIAATNEKRGPNYRIIEEIVSEAFMPIGYGGGVSKLDQIEKLYSLGIEKVILNTVTHSNSELVRQAAKIFGRQSIVIAVDVKKDFLGKNWIYTNSGNKKQKENIQEFLQFMEQLGAGEVIINSIDREGTLSGYDIDLIRDVSKYLSIPVVASGGAGKIEDFSEAINAGASALAAGAMFVFQGINKAVLISYPEYSDLEKALNYKIE